MAFRPRVRKPDYTRQTRTISRELDFYNSTLSNLHSHIDDLINEFGKDCELLYSDGDWYVERQHVETDAEYNARIQKEETLWKQHVESELFSRRQNIEKLREQLVEEEATIEGIIRDNEDVHRNGSR